MKESDQAKVEALRAALTEGEESDLAGPFDFDEIKREARTGLRDEKIRSSPVRAMRATSKSWPVANPFIERRIVGADDIDGFGHVNNVRYVAWANDIAWAHSEALGLSFADYERIGAGCVVWRHEFDYVAPALQGETVDVATWIAENDGRVRLVRAYEMRRMSDRSVLFRGSTKFVTIDMSTGKPMRMPKEFVEAYRPTV